MMDKQLSQLVDDEIISQDEADTREEHKAYFEENKDKKVSILDQMVDENSLIN